MLSARALVEAARRQVGKTLTYDPSYVKLSYPLGDVPLDRGVCTDVVIRALRVFGIDLQKEVYQSIAQNPKLYKKDLSRGVADRNIDHRRVKVLARYFKAQGWHEQTTQYQPGDILVFELRGGLWHIAVVSDRFVRAPVAKDQGGNNAPAGEYKRPLIIHNIGSGVLEEDCIDKFPVLFCFRIAKIEKTTKRAFKAR